MLRYSIYFCINLFISIPIHLFLSIDLFTDSSNDSSIISISTSHPTSHSIYPTLFFFSSSPIPLIIIFFFIGCLLFDFFVHICFPSSFFPPLFSAFSINTFIWFFVLFYFRFILWIFISSCLTIHIYIPLTRSILWSICHRASRRWD